MKVFEEMELSLIQEYAVKIMTAFEDGSYIELISDSHPNLDIKDAYRIAEEIEKQRLLQDEKVVGVKIGFTNRNIWEEYNATAPIVGAMYDTTVLSLESGLSIQKFLKPRIEPEIIFKLRETPDSSMRDYELLGCIASVAHGFEVVHSIFKDWNFKMVDTIAAFGLHGALLHGPFHEVFETDRNLWLKELSTFNINLSLNGEVVDQGTASNVLGCGPLEALRHILNYEKNIGHSITLKPGDIVTTGTLTGAHPIGVNQNWSTEITGINLEGASVKFY